MMTSGAHKPPCFDLQTRIHDKFLISNQIKSNSSVNHSKKDESEDFCCICDDGGKLLCCDGCPRVFHPDCLEPPLTSMPKGSWKCFMCIIETLEKVDRILTWRETGGQREFFVHFAGKSYWQCKWVPEIQLKNSQPVLLRCYYTKYGNEEPPILDEGDARRLKKNQRDPLELRFYQFGIRPEWLRIDRIIAHRLDDRTNSYLVKWQNLGYDYSTWEDRKTCSEILSDFTVAISVYKEWLNYFGVEPDKRCSEKPIVYRHIKIPPGKPVSNVMCKLKKQPEYIPKGMRLHDYQLEGLNWLRYSWANGTNTILGDEMGLGKTIQTIVFLNSLYQEGRCRGPFLISAPLSTLLNWEREFQAWAPDMYVVTYSGDQDTRLLIRKTELVRDSSYMTAQHKNIRGPVKFHVLLTSYQFPSFDSTFLGSIPWEMIIIDEGHRLKDDGTLLFKDLMKYKTSYKLLLTGTPLQNNLKELFNLLNFLCPDKFDDSTKFLTEFEDIAKEDQVKKLHSLLGPHMLRRMKADVLKDLPGKSEMIVRVELSPMQKQYSKHILTKNFKALNAKGGRHTSLLNIFMDLRKVCNHPYLFATACAAAPEDPVTGLYDLEAMTEASGKFVMLRKMLKLLKRQGHRVLIFSQMTTMMDILEEFLTALGHSYERIDGNVVGSFRQDSIDRFNAEGAEQFVFLLSTKAGGLGINLATADTVIVFDSDWNPHNDIQAFSRAHRIGQKNKVMIYRFVTRRSVEEKIVQVCKRKMMLTHLIVRPEVGTSLFSRAELDEIIRFGTEELFKDQDINMPMYYTDSAIESLLDRTKEDAKEPNDRIDDYFQAFKVANFEILEKIGTNNEEEAKDPDQWKYLIKQEIKRKEDEDEALNFQNYGKGMRRKSVNYMGLAPNEEVVGVKEWRPSHRQVDGKKERKKRVEKVGTNLSSNRQVSGKKERKEGVRKVGTTGYYHYLPSKQIYRQVRRSRVYSFRDKVVPAKNIVMVHRKRIRANTVGQIAGRGKEMPPKHKGGQITGRGKGRPRKHKGGQITGRGKGRPRKHKGGQITGRGKGRPPKHKGGQTTGRGKGRPPKHKVGQQLEKSFASKCIGKRKVSEFQTEEDKVSILSKCRAGSLIGSQLKGGLEKADRKSKYDAEDSEENCEAQNSHPCIEIKRQSEEWHAGTNVDIYMKYRNVLKDFSINLKPVDNYNKIYKDKPKVPAGNQIANSTSEETKTVESAQTIKRPQENETNSSSYRQNCKRRKKMVRVLIRGQSYMAHTDDVKQSGSQKNVTS